VEAEKERMSVHKQTVVSIINSRAREWEVFCNETRYGRGCHEMRQRRRPVNEILRNSEKHQQ
jgi:hypothetical protein